METKAMTWVDQELMQQVGMPPPPVPLDVQEIWGRILAMDADAFVRRMQVRKRKQRRSV